MHDKILYITLSFESLERKYKTEIEIIVILKFLGLTKLYNQFHLCFISSPLL